MRENRYSGNQHVKKWAKRLGLLASGAVGGFAFAVALLIANHSEPEKPAEVDSYLELEATFQRLPEHETLVAEILGFASLESNIRVYLDTYNPSLCGRADARLRTIILSEDCSKPLRIKSGYHWRNVGILTHEVGHILNGHGTEQGLAPSPDTPEWQQDEADAFARWAMKALGATLEEIKTSAPQDGIAPDA